MTDPADDPPELSRTRSRLHPPPAVVRSGRDAVSAELALTLFRQMVRTRALEERSIKMSKSGEAYFWIGGPGEEAVNVALGLQVHKGAGPAHDYLHLHYRNAGVLLAMGMPMADHVRQLAMTSTDPFSRGRNFVGHYAVPAWNVVPVSSVIQVQCVMAPGTALVQKRFGGEGLTVCVSGEAGTAEGDFSSGLQWSTRPGAELPVLWLVMNNGYGISTPSDGQTAARRVADRALPFDMPAATVDGADPVAVWAALDRAMRYVRRHRRPFLLEAVVSRLHGHSSSSGAGRVAGEPDGVARFGHQLVACGATDPEGVAQSWADARAEADAAVVVATGEPGPAAADVERFTYAPSDVDVVYPVDYTGLPGR